MIELTFNELEIISESLSAKWERLKETEHQVYSNAIRGLMNRITKKKDALWDAEPSKIEPSTPLNCEHLTEGYVFINPFKEVYGTIDFTYCPTCGEKL